MLETEIMKYLTRPISLESHDFLSTITNLRKQIYTYDKRMINQQGDFHTKSGKCIYEINNVKYSCLFIKGKSDSLTVSYNGAKYGNYNYLDDPYIPRWSYYPLYAGCFLGIDDPMYHVYKTLPLGWYYGDKNNWYLFNSIELIKYVCELNKIPLNRVTFFSSSGGGYASLVASALLPNSTGIAINPQLDISKHTFSKSFERITNINLADHDSLMRNNVSEILLNSKSKQIIIVNINSNDDLYIQLIPFLKKLGISEISYGLNRFNNILIWLYDAPGLPSAHVSFETKAIACAIHMLADEFNNENFDLEKWQKIILLINEYWHDYYSLLKENRDTLNMLTNEIIFINDNLSTTSNDFDEFCDITIGPSKGDYNFYKININAINSIYTFYIPTLYSKTCKKITYGIYDFKSQKK